MSHDDDPWPHNPATPTNVSKVKRRGKRYSTDKLCSVNALLALFHATFANIKELYTDMHNNEKGCHCAILV